MVFCPDSPYMPNTNWSADAAKYAAAMPKVTFSHMYVTENQSGVDNNLFQYTDLDTIYNGRCQLLESDVEITHGTYVKLIADENELNGSKIWLYAYNPGSNN